MKVQCLQAVTDLCQGQGHTNARGRSRKILSVGSLEVS